MSKVVTPNNKPWPPRRLLWIAATFLYASGAVLCADPTEVAEAKQAEPQVRVWTREAAVDYALRHNQRILASHASLQRQTGRMWTTRSRMLPRVSVRSQVSAREDSLVDRSASAEEVPNSEQTAIATEAYDGTLEIRQLLFDGSSASSQYRGSKAQVEGALWLQRDVMLRVVNEVEQIFDNLLAHNQEFKILRETVRLRSRLVELTRKQVEAGAAIEFQLLRAEAELARAEGALAEGMAERSQAWERFVNVLQLPADEAGRGLESVRFEGDLELIEWKMEPDRAIARALRKNRRIQASEFRLEAADDAIRAARRSGWPRVEGFANYGSRSSYFDVDRNLHGYTVGVSVTWDIFDGFNRQGQILSRLGERAEARHEQAALKLGVQQAISTAYSQLQSVTKSIAAERRAIDLSEKGYRQALRQYEVGLVDLQEMIDAQVFWENSQLELIDGIRRHNQAVYQIRYLAALPDGADATAKTPEDIVRESDVGLLRPPWRSR